MHCRASCSHCPCSGIQVVCCSHDHSRPMSHDGPNKAVLPGSGILVVKSGKASGSDANDAGSSSHGQFQSPNPDAPQNPPPPKKKKKKQLLLLPA